MPFNWYKLNLLLNRAEKELFHVFCEQSGTLLLNGFTSLR